MLPSVAGSTFNELHLYRDSDARALLESLEEHDIAIRVMNLRSTYSNALYLTTLSPKLLGGEHRAIHIARRGTNPFARLEKPRNCRRIQRAPYRSRKHHDSASNAPS